MRFLNFRFSRATHEPFLFCLSPLTATSGVAVASFEAAMAALRTAPSPVPLVFHRATRAHAEASVVAEAGPTAAAAAETAEEERATAEEAEARPDSNWRIVNIG